MHSTQYNVDVDATAVISLEFSSKEKKKQKKQFQTQLKCDNPRHLKINFSEVKVNVIT